MSEEKHKDPVVDGEASAQVYEEVEGQVVDATDQVATGDTGDVDPVVLANDFTEEELEEIEEETLEEPGQVNESSVLPGVPVELFNQLTSKNTQFIVNVDKHLGEQVRPDIKERINLEIVETLLEGQLTHTTAKQIYGTPTETVATILEQEYPAESESGERSPDWQIALDGGLMLGSIYTLITGLAMLNSEEGQMTMAMGVTTMIINYIVAAFAMLATSQVLPDFDAEKGKRGIGKYLLVSTLAMVGWIFMVTMSTAFLPAAINPILPAPIYLAIGGITLAARFLLKRNLNIRGGVF